MSRLIVQDKDFYNVRSLGSCFQEIARRYGEDDPCDYDSFSRWVHCSRVLTYFKKLGLPYSLYEKALSLSSSNVKHVKILLVLFLTEVLGRETTEEITVSMNEYEKEVADITLTLYLEPGNPVSYTLNYVEEKHPEGTQIANLYIYRR